MVYKNRKTKKKYSYKKTKIPNNNSSLRTLDDLKIPVYSEKDYQSNDGMLTTCFLTLFN